MFEVGRKLAGFDVRETEQTVLVKCFVYENVLFARLHQILSLFANFLDKSKSVELLFPVNLLVHGIECDVGPGAAHSGRAMYHNRVLLWRMGFVDVAYQVQHTHRVRRGRVFVGPVRVKVLRDTQYFCVELVAL